MIENVIVTKTYSFAVKIVRFCFEMQEHKREYVLSHQLLKCGTSIGANTEEAQGSISITTSILKTSKENKKKNK